MELLKGSDYPHAAIMPLALHFDVAIGISRTPAFRSNGYGVKALVSSMFRQSGQTNAPLAAPCVPRTYCVQCSSMGSVEVLVLDERPMKSWDDQSGD